MTSAVTVPITEKKCYECQRVLSVKDNFHKDSSRGDGYEYRCRECKKGYRNTPERKEADRKTSRESKKKVLKERYRLIQQMKSAIGCVICENEFTGVCLDWHHKHGTQDKVDTVSNMVCWNKWSDVLSEIEKCEPICANCHKVLTLLSINYNPYVYKSPRTLEREELIRDILKESGCVCCREENFLTLEFHHLDEFTKMETVSRLRGNRSKSDALFEEMDKCAIVCRNCHRKLTQGLLLLIPRS
jgi:hypothetical protein